MQTELYWFLLLTLCKKAKKHIFPERWTIPLMHRLVFVLHSAACHWISILRRDKRQLTISNIKEKPRSQQSLSLKWKYVLYQNTARIVYINLRCPTRLQQRACYNYYLPFSFSLPTRVNNADAMNETCLEIETRSCFVRRLASFHTQGFNIFFFSSLSLQLMRLVYYEWMSVTLHYQLSALISVIMCMLMLPHTVYCSDLNRSSAWPWFVSTKLLTESWLNWNSYTVRTTTMMMMIYFTVYQKKKKNAGCIKLRVVCFNQKI